MIKKIIYSIFLRHYNLNAIENTEIIKKYNSLGMVKPSKNPAAVKYYATPAIASRKCLSKSRTKYGFKKGENVDKVLDEVYSYYAEKKLKE